LSEANQGGGPDRPLILCIGNTMRGDDGAGPAAADRLRPLVGDRADIEVSWGEGTELMQAWQGRAQAIVVDAATSGAETGTVHVFNAAAESLPRDFFCYTTHRFGLAEAVEFARQLGELPERLTIYAIEGTNFDLGEGVSAAVDAGVDRVVERITAALG